MAKTFLSINMNVSREEVIEFLQEIQIPAKVIETEKKLQEFLFDKLKEKFRKVAKEYSIGGYLGLKIDIDIFDGEVGIELKLAKELKNVNDKTNSVNIQRLFGQAIYYKTRKYKDDLIVVIAGDKNSKTDPVFEEIGYLMKKIDVDCLYLVAK